MAWPPNVTDNVDIVAAAHINSIVAAIQTWQGDVTAGGFRLLNVAGLSIGVAQPLSGAIKLHVRVGANQNLWVQQGQLDVNAVAISAGNDPGSTNVALELRASKYILFLPNTNPGAGQALWYDPADGNRVKFAP